jgi:hypothetical protein
MTKLGGRWVHQSARAPLCCMVDTWLRKKINVSHWSVAPPPACLGPTHVRLLSTHVSFLPAAAVRWNSHPCGVHRTRGRTRASMDPSLTQIFFKVVINLVDAHQQLSSRNDRIKSMGCTFKTIYSHRPKNKCSSRTSKVNRSYI